MDLLGYIHEDSSTFACGAVLVRIQEIADSIFRVVRGNCIARDRLTLHRTKQAKAVGRAGQYNS